MKATLFFGSFLLSSLAAAAPLDKRAYLWKTVTQEVIETVEVTSTVWVDAGATIAASTPSSSAAAATTPGAFFEQPYSSSAAPVSVQAYTPSSSTTPSSTPTPTPSSSPAAASTPAVASTPAYTPPAPSSTPAYTPPPVPSTSATPSPASTPAYTPSSSAAPAATSSPSGPSGQTYSGDITYYQPAGGLGSCGWAISNSDHVVALAEGMMGNGPSNGNPWCGKKIAISINGKVWPATIGDKCPGCQGASIDLTEGLWDLAATGIDGRGHNIKWWVTE